MNIKEAIMKAWGRVVQDFDRDCKNGLGIYWNEEVLRLRFFHNLLIQDVDIAWFTAEFKVEIEDKKYKPDLIINFRIDDEVRRCCFEFKFGGYTEDWKKSWKKLLKYGEAMWDEYIGFDSGYFMAIGPIGWADIIPKVSKENDYEVKAIIHEVPWDEISKAAEPITIVRKLLEETLDMPYYEYPGDKIFHGWVITSVEDDSEDYAIIFDATDRVLLLKLYIENNRRNKIEQELKKVGFEKWTNDIFLLKEFELNTSEENVKSIKRCLKRLKPILVGLNPTLKLR